MNDDYIPEQVIKAHKVVREMMGVPSLPAKRPKLVIHIEIDNNDIDSAILDFDGHAIDAIEGLFVAGMYCESLIRPIIAASAMLIGDNAELQKCFDKTKEYFLSTQSHE